MLERLKELPAGVVGVRASGKVTQTDYETVLKPILDEERRAGHHVRFLYHFGPEFEGFSPAGAWEDARVGMQYLRLFTRCAVVSDVSWIRQSSQLFGAMFPCPVRVFSESEWQDAIQWISAPAAEAVLPHRLLSEAGVLIVEPEAPLRSEDFEAVALTVDPYIEAEGRLRGIVIHARRFPGWEDLGSLIRHVRFMKDHHRKVDRVALAMDGRLAEMAPKFAEHFVNAEIEQFGYDDIDEAIAWAGSGAGAEEQEEPAHIPTEEPRPPAA